MNNYDYVIVGAGPSGLTLAFYLSKLSYRCLIIDQNKTIGGCHRVNRVNNLFAEHGPRVYSSSYVNTIKLLQDMNLNFYDLFTPYNFRIADIQNESFGYFTIREMSLFVIEFVKLLFNSKHGKKQSIYQFMKYHNFSDKAHDYVNRLCKLTDGEDAHKYPLNKFLNLFNQQFFYKLYQPTKPNDDGLFKLMESKLLQTKNITIMKDAKIISLTGSNKQVNSILVKTNNKTLNIPIKNKLVLCIPPYDILQIIKKSKYNNAFGKNFEEWAIFNNYDNYISISFHWNKTLKLPKIWGFPRNEWGIAFIILSDYMKMKNHTLISTAVTFPNVKSSRINKTANECNKQELFDEVFRQLKVSYPDLPKPSNIILNPSNDTAFVESYKNEFIDFGSNINNLYTVGTHTGQSVYAFTSFESAVSNAIKFMQKIENYNIPFKTLTSLTNVIRYLLILIIIVIILLVIVFIIKKSKFSQFNN